MIDLDKFKTLNDTYGHEAGDRALRIFAEAVRATVRADDIVGRWGGEEFVLALPGGNVPQLLEALARLRGELTEAVGRAGAPVFTASFGATDSTAAATIEELMRLADAALLDLKAQGRDRVVVAEGRRSSAIAGRNDPAQTNNGGDTRMKVPPARADPAPTGTPQPALRPNYWLKAASTARRKDAGSIAG